MPISANAKVSISNCTFYNWATSKSSYTAIGNFSKLSVALPLSVNACVFGYSAGKALVPGQINLTGKNNYCTTDFEQAADTGLTLIDLSMSDSSFSGMLRMVTLRLSIPGLRFIPRNMVTRAG